MSFLVLIELFIYLASGFDNFISYVLINSYICLLALYFVGLFKVNIASISANEKSLILILLTMKFLISAFLFIYIYYLQFPDARLLPPDAQIIHIPQIQAWYDYFKFNKELDDLTRFGRYYISNFYIAIIYLISDNLMISIVVGLLILFISNIILVYKNCSKIFKSEIFDGGLLSLMVLFGAPSFTYYSLQLYKEGMFYLMLNLLIYTTLKKKYFLMFIIFSLICYERFYSGFLIFFALSLMFFIQAGLGKKILIIIISPFILYCIFLLAFPDFDLDATFTIVKGFASNHSLSDAGLGSKFPFSLLQIALSPIPNVFKIEYWNYQDRLLIAAFVFSVLTLVSFTFCKTKQKLGFVSFSWYIYILYLLLWSFLAPFNGRARDAIYPFIIILVCHFLGKYRYKNLKVIKQ